MVRLLAFGHNPCCSVVNSLPSLQLALGDTPQAADETVQSGQETNDTATAFAVFSFRRGRSLPSVRR